MALTVSGPDVDVTLRGYGLGAALSRALTEAESARREVASYYVRDEQGVVLGRVDREGGQTLVRRVSAPRRRDDRVAVRQKINGQIHEYEVARIPLDRGAEDVNLEGEPARARATGSASEASSTRRPGPRPSNPKKEEPKMAQKTQTRKRSSSSSAKKRTSTARSSAPAQPKAAEVVAPAAAEGDTATEVVAGQDLYKALLAEVKTVVQGVEAKPNKSNTYTRLLKGGKAFAYLFPPRKGGVALKIPKQLLAVERELPAGHGFKVTGWGLTRTLKDPAETQVVAKALAVAAKAVAAKAVAAKAVAAKAVAAK